MTRDELLDAYEALYENVRSPVERLKRMRVLKREYEMGPATSPTLRDQFAMAALTGLMASGVKGSSSGDPHQVFAIAAYRTADAMMAERERGK